MEKRAPGLVLYLCLNQATLPKAVTTLPLGETVSVFRLL